MIAVLIYAAFSYLVGMAVGYVIGESRALCTKKTGCVLRIGDEG